MHGNTFLAPADVPVEFPGLMGERKTRKLMASGHLPYYKAGRSVRIHRRDIEAWLAANRIESATKGVTNVTA